MLSHAAFLKQIKPAVEEVRRVGKLHGKSYSPEYSVPMHCYSHLDSAFTPIGQYDLDVREELRAVLKKEPIAVTSSALAGAVQRITAHQRIDPDEAIREFSAFCDDVSAAADLGEIAPFAAYWLRLTAYCCCIVYGPAGAALPDFPISPETESTPEAFRHPRIHLSTVPGARRQGPYGHDGEAMSGLPDDEHDLEGTGWRR